jgi:hypothetical protein
LLAGFIFRPFMFFILPGLILGLLALYILGWTVANVISVYDLAPAGSYFDDQFSAAVAQVFHERPHAFFVGGITALISLQLLSLGFLSYQSKRYFEELFHLASGVREQVLAAPVSSADVECCGASGEPPGGDVAPDTGAAE